MTTTLPGLKRYKIFAWRHADMAESVALQIICLSMKEEKYLLWLIWKDFLNYFLCTGVKKSIRILAWKQVDIIKNVQLQK